MTKHFDPNGNELRPYSVRRPSHPLLRNFVPSEVETHITALEKAGIYDDLTQEQQATIIGLMQAAFRNGQAQQGAEKVDNDAVWVNDIGMIERQPDSTWLVTGYDAAKDVEMIRARNTELGVGYTIQRYDEWARQYYARQLGSKGGSANTPAQKAARAMNAKKGGWPKGKKRKSAAF